MLSWNYCPSKLDRVGLGSKKKIKIFVDRLPSARRQGKELVFFSTLLISWIFQILKDDVVKVLHSICPQIWKTQQWPWHWKRSVFIPTPKKGNAQECSNYWTMALISHASKVMLTILPARLQQYVNLKLPDVQARFRKGRGTRNQIANIRWIMEKARKFQKNIYFCFIDYVKAFDCVVTINSGKF